MGKRENLDIFCFQISVVSIANTVKLCTSVCGKPQNKMNCIYLCFTYSPKR